MAATFGLQKGLKVLSNNVFRFIQQTLLNHPIHTSKQVREYWDKWQQQGLFFFQLPKYSSEMNLIETEWHQLKTHELAGQIFPDEYDLAIAVKQGIEARAQKGGHETHCFKFNSA